MGLGSLNYLAVMAAAVASFVFGGIWYNVFSRQWLEAVGMSPERMQERGGVGLYVLALRRSARHGVDAGRHPAASGAGRAAGDAWNGVVSGAFIWLGFVITTMVVNYAFHGARHALTLIDGGHWLGVLLIQGAILGWWGPR